MLVLQTVLQLLKILVSILTSEINCYTNKVLRGVTTNHSLCEINRIHDFGGINGLRLAHAQPRFVSVKLILCASSLQKSINYNN